LFLEIFYELVFSAEFVEISEMVDFLLRCKFLLVKFGDELFFAPDNIPAVALYFFIASCVEGLEDAVAKIGLEFDCWSVSDESYICEWYSCLMYFLNKSFMLT
jgi:hypothetical protein